MQNSVLLDYFSERQTRFVEFVCELCEIESPSGDVEGSRAAVELLAATGRKLKNVDSVEKIAADNYGEHLLIRAFGKNRTEKPILLLGHTDTVYERGTLAARPFKIDGDKIFAPGIFDMKNGCALIFETLAALEKFELKPRRPIHVLLSCDEETGSATGRAIVEREAANAAFCLVFEPSANGRAKTGRKGTATFSVAAHGIAAHAGLEPEKGASAILEIARQIPRLHALADLAQGTTVNVTQTSGGTASNVIAEFAGCTVDARFAVMSEAARVEREIKNLTVCDDRVKLSVTGEINRPPLERTGAVADLYQRAQNIAASLDYELGETSVGGASDGNFVGALGVPVLDGLGLRGDGAHAAHEHILISDFARRAALISLLLLDL